MKEIITKETMEEYEKIRSSGVTNMFDYQNVMSYAKKQKCTALQLLSFEEYKYLLRNFGPLMEKFNIQYGGK